MTSLREALAERSGVPVVYIDHLIELGILASPVDGSPISPGDVRRVRLVHGMEQGGLPLEGIATAVRNGDLSFAFLDSHAWDWYGGFSGKTYREVSVEAGIGMDLLLALRESMGFGRAAPDDIVHEEELDLIPVTKIMVETGVDPEALGRLVRVWGDSMRRITEAAANFYQAQIERPLLQSGMSVGQMILVANEATAAGIPLLDRAIVAMYHGHSERTWLGNVVESVEAILERSGLHSTVAMPPAMCFLDLSGYTRLTEERGDHAAAETAATLGGLVQQSAGDHGGRMVKWLGDGVMLYFDEPGRAVLSAIDLAERVPAAGLPQTHAGIDAGPVIMQDGDYFGRTVNTAARIAAHAGPGEVLVSERAERSVEEPRVRFDDAGLVELKGLAQPIRLYRARVVR